MSLALYIHEKLLFELLRVSLNEVEPDLTFLYEVKEEDWKACFKLSVQQGVSSLAWDGVMKLPSRLLPPKNVKIPWAMAVEKQEKRYLHYVKIASMLRSMFLEHGIAVVQLKGTGLSTYYPNPAHREGGDIDLYTFSADVSNLSDSEAQNLSDKLIENLGIKVEKNNPKHSEFYFHNIPVENHKRFLNTVSMESAVLLDSYLKEILNPQHIELANGKYEMMIPSSSFNTLFLAYHTLQHYGEGLSLHHFCDWACLLNRYGLVIPTEMRNQRFANFIYCITTLTNKYLGTQVEVPYDDETLQKILLETLRPPFPKTCVERNKIRQFVYKTKRFWHYLTIRKEVMGDSRLRAILHSTKSHLQKPQTIFYK